MEVHAHTHTPGKKWTHYFWEFLMLFLAVFCGFLAENQREHMVEHNRAKAYAQSLFKDLQNDTADIRKAAAYENKIVTYIDSLVDFISNPLPSQKSGLLYFYMRLAAWSYNVDWNKATLNQLINSGNLRYFSNTKLVTQISNYNTLINIITNQDETIDKKRTRAVAYRDQVLVAKYQQAFSSFNLDDIYSGRKKEYIDSLINYDFPFYNNSAEKINAFANAVLDTKNNRQNQQMTYYPKAIMLATEIMKLLKREYHID
jgi:hypothetical protein